MFTERFKAAVRGFCGVVGLLAAIVGGVLAYVSTSVLTAQVDKAATGNVALACFAIAIVAGFIVLFTLEGSRPGHHSKHRPHF